MYAIRSYYVPCPEIAVDRFDPRDFRHFALELLHDETIELVEGVASAHRAVESFAECLRVGRGACEDIELDDIVA